VVHAEDSEAVLEERRDVAVPQIQATRQEAREVTQTDLDVQGNGAGAKEVGVWMEESPQAISDTESATASQATSPKRPKNKS
jgi:hypothetical protein